MEAIDNTLIILATDYWLVMAFCYYLALVQRPRLLLFVAFCIALVFIYSFFGYPEFYLEWIGWFLDLMRLMPSVEIFDIPVTYQAQIQESFTRGAFLALAGVSSGLSLYMPVRAYSDIKPED